MHFMHLHANCKYNSSIVYSYTCTNQLTTLLIAYTVQLKGNVALAARHTLALNVYNIEFYSFATQKSLYT